MRSEETLYLLVNDDHARLLKSAGTADHLTEIGRVERKNFANSHTRSAAGKSADHAEHARTNFVTHVAEFARKVWVDEGKPRVMVAAPAKVLGALRPALSKPLAGAVVSEQHKDLVDLPLHDLPEHFRHVGVV